MVLRTKSNRSKSMSDIVDNAANDEGKSQENSAFIENRYRTYTFKDFKEKEEYFTNDSFCDQKKLQSPHKSQNFVKKLIASLERKNEACKADDEFVSTYYKRNGSSNSDYLLEQKPQTPERIKKLGVKIPIPNVELNTIFSRDCRQEQNSEVFARNQVPVFANVVPQTKFSPKNDEYIKNSNSKKSGTENPDKIESGFKINEQRNVKYYIDINSKNEREKRNFSSFDPNQYIVELQNRTDVVNSYFLKSNEYDSKGNTSENIFINPKIEENSRKGMFNGNSKKTLRRNKSFKDLFGSIIKWKKSESKEKPQRFLSCDHLFQNFEQDEERKATIHPVYGGKRNEQLSNYTCFNISPSYIILGSTSGSLYLFSRKPCSFIQLIPLSEGIVSRILISPDEKTIALTTTRGVICLVALKPVLKLIAISTEYVRKNINSLCWNDNSCEIYVGDENGRVSVIVLSIFTVNGIFQAPACTLMNLDSAIVQLTFSSPFLLVSTLTRCYICDTIQEQYKQVGNKARNGEFGACFYKIYPTENKSAPIDQKEGKLVNKKGFFNFIAESSSKVQEENFPQIFCSRPGSRLWEVAANGTVIKTHQFKEALAIAPATICKPNIRKSNYQKNIEQTWLPQSINFSHLFVIAKKYLFSYTSTGLYIIDPITATVVLWNNEFSNISFVETIENKIYLMTSSGEFHCLVLCSLDSLILQLYNKKKYYECLEICLMYKVQLKKIVNNTKINNICDIENKLQIFRDDELSTLLHPLINLLESNLKITPKKLDSGIVVVNYGNSSLKGEENCIFHSVSHCSLQNNENLFETELEAGKETSTSLLDDFDNKVIQDEDTNCNTAKEIVEAQDEELSVTKEELNSNKNVTHKIQVDLEAIYALVSNIKSSMDEEELEKIILDIDWKMNVIKDSYENLVELKNYLYEVLRSVELYYFNALLENISIQLIQSTDNENIIKQILKAFINVNAQNCRRCTCSNPYPTNEVTEPKFLGFGTALLKKMLNENKEECINLCNKVPYMWRDYLPLYTERHGILMNDILRQCLQTRDSIVFSILLPLLDGNHWKIVATYAKEIQEGQCLFCGKSIRKGNREESINWTVVIYEIMKRQGPDIAMTLLIKLEKAIPNVPIDISIFQSLIFTKLIYRHGMKCTINFNKSNLESSQYNTICSTQIQNQLVKVLEKDLSQPINKNIFENGPHHWGMHYQNKLSTCPCCTLSLQTPVLLGNNGIAIFDCGHAYHVNCIIEKKLTACTLHS